MGAGTVRSGAPVAGTVAVSGTDNSLTAPRVITFPTPVRPCWIRLAAAVQATTAPVLVKVNAEPATTETVNDDFATGSGASHTLSSINETIDLSEGGIIAIHSISIATQHDDDDLDDVVIAAFSP